MREYNVLSIYARTQYTGICSNFSWNHYDNSTLNYKGIT